MKKIFAKLFIVFLCIGVLSCTSAQSAENVPTAMTLSDIMNSKYYEPSEVENFEEQDVFMPNTYESSLPQKPLKGGVYVVPAGTSFSARMQSSISSRTMKVGDNIAALLDKDWVHNNKLIAPAGSILYGEVKKANASGKAMKNGKIELKFTEVETINGETIELAANNYVVKVDQNRAWEVTKNVSQKTATGAFAGWGLANVTNSKHTEKVVGVAAAIGLVWGIFDTMTSHEGQEVELPSNTPVTIRLVEPINVDMAIINQNYL